MLRSWAWHSDPQIKYEEVCLRAYECVSQAKWHLARCIAFHNERGLKSGLDGRTPDHVYFTSLPPLAAAP